MLHLTAIPLRSGERLSLISIQKQQFLLKGGLSGEARQ